ncbi:hypothetical protein ES703_104590 [subsurface metagenome]
MVSVSLSTWVYLWEFGSALASRSVGVWVGVGVNVGVFVGV